MHIAVCLFPGFQALDVFGPMDAFNFLSMSHKELTISILSATLDPVPTKPSPSFSQSVVPTHTYSDPPSEQIDVVFVPGGIGLREPTDELEKWLADNAPRARFVLTVCTGSAVLSRTGVLDGVRATTNKRSWDWATPQGPKVNWVRKARWVVSGKFWTSSGVSAGIDMALAWIESEFGTHEATAIADRMEYVWNKDPDHDPFA